MVTSPESLIRNSQIGDWHVNGRILVRVLENTLPEQSELAVMCHELIEAYLCQRDGVTDEQVCAFDEMFERERSEGKHGDDEPGDDPRSPYRDQHMAATHVERSVCAALGINWNDHCKSVNES